MQSHCVMNVRVRCFKLSIMTQDVRQQYNLVKARVVLGPSPAMRPENSDFEVLHFVLDLSNIDGQKDSRLRNSLVRTVL